MTEKEAHVDKMETDGDEQNESNYDYNVSESDSLPTISVETATKLNLDMIAKSICSLPLPLIGLVSSYLSVDDTNIHTDEYSKMAEERYVQEISNFFDSLLCNPCFLLKIMVGSSHTSSCVGLVPTYDVSVCNSDTRFITSTVLNRALEKQSLVFLEGKMLKHRFDVALSYVITQLYNTETDTGSISFLSEENSTNNTCDITIIDKDQYFNSVFDRSYIFLSGCVNTLAAMKDILRRNEFVLPFCDNLNDQIESKKESDRTIRTEDEDSMHDKSVDNNEQTMSIYDILDVNRENLIRTFIPSHTNSNGVPISTVKQQQQNEKKLTSEADIIEYFKRKDISRVYANHTSNQYEIQIDEKKISQCVGIWGDDLYLRYLGAIRKMRTFTGYDDYKDISNLKEQDGYESYFDPNISSSVGNKNDDSNTSNKYKSTSTKSEKTKTNETSNQTNNNTNSKRSRNVLSYLIEERLAYCNAITDAISNVFSEMSKYINNSLQKYNDLVKSTHGLRSSQRNIYKRNLEEKDYNMSNRSNTNTSQSVYYPNKYVGTVLYEETKQRTQELRKALNIIMDKYEKILYFDDSSTVNIRDYPIERENVELYYPEILNLYDESFEDYCRIMETDKQKLTYHRFIYLDEVFNKNILEHVKLSTSIHLHVEISCIEGFPECLLYEEQSLLKLITIIWRSKTDDNTLSFNNEENKNHVNLYNLISKLWTAKSFIMLSEYDSVSTAYDELYMKTVMNKIVGEKRKDK